MPSKLLKSFLDENDIKYISISHSLAFTAVDIAKSAHIPSKEMAKTVIIKVDGNLAMVVVPANYKVKLDILKAALDTDDVELATEQEFTSVFRDCEVGAMPPFGNLYDMEVYVAESLTEDDKINFNAGSHSEIMQMDYKDFENLVKPKFVLLAN
ncbi:MAG: YbaK/EbsC family protein [Gammaproteobacteria bacterium]|nr:MAG: YbaK/EbsC family protein [Gammaproteobacteria bacterium]